MRLLIDGDTVAFKAVTAVEDKYYPSLRAVDFTLENILSKFDYSGYVLGIGGSGNFRKALYPLYKSDRKEKPKCILDVYRYMKKYWDAVEATGMETDDLLAIEHDSCSILVVQDKDYKQCGGKIYNYWSKDPQVIEITNPEFYFYRQLLTGDRQDCIPGIPNPAKAHWKTIPNFTDDTASALLEDKSPEEMKDIVQGLYREIYGDSWFTEYDLRARLLFLRRKDATEYFQKY